MLKTSMRVADFRFMYLFIVVCSKTLPLFYYIAWNGRMVCGITWRECERIGCGLCRGNTSELFG